MIDAAGRAARRVRRHWRQRRLDVRARVVGRLRVLRQHGEPVRGAGRAERPRQDRLVERARRVVELLGEHALDDQAVHRGPRRGVRSGEGEHRGPVAGRADRGDVVVDALGVREQRGAGLAGGARPLVLRGAQQAEPQLELVAAQVARAGELREAALPQAALQVHLRQPELRVHVPHRQKQVVRVRGVDGGEALTAVRDGDRRGQPGHVQRLRAGRLPAGSRRPRAPAGVERGAESRYRSVAEAEYAKQCRRHHHGGDRVEHRAQSPAACSPVTDPHSARFITLVQCSAQVTCTFRVGCPLLRPPYRGTIDYGARLPGRAHIGTLRW